jgi:hypothetical protein
MEWWGFEEDWFRNGCGWELKLKLKLKSRWKYIFEVRALADFEVPPTESFSGTSNLKT